MRAARRISLVAAGLLMAALPAALPAAAQDEGQTLVPLEQIVKDGAQLSTVALHCAGLFHSVWDFTGEEALGPEASAQAKDNAAFFMKAGQELRATETGGAPAQGGSEAVAEAFAVSTLYYKKYAENTATTGSAYALDEGWNSDLEICKNLAAQL